MGGGVEGWLSVWIHTTWYWLKAFPVNCIFLMIVLWDAVLNENDFSNFPQMYRNSEHLCLSECETTDCWKIYLNYVSLNRGYVITHKHFMKDKEVHLCGQQCDLTAKRWSVQVPAGCVLCRAFMYYSLCLHGLSMNKPGKPPTVQKHTS